MTAINKKTKQLTVVNCLRFTIYTVLKARCNLLPEV